MLHFNKNLTKKARKCCIDYRLVKLGRGNPLFNPLGLGNPLPIGRLITGLGIAPFEFFLAPFNSSVC